MGHVLKCESSGEVDNKFFNQLRNEFEGSATDISADQCFVDCPNIVGDLEALAEDVDRMLREDVDLSSPEVASSRMMPNCISTTDALHIIFRGTGRGVEEVRALEGSERSAALY